MIRSFVCQTKDLSFYPVTLQMMGGELRLKTRALCVVLSDRRASYSGKSFVVVENRVLLLGCTYFLYICIFKNI